MESEIIPFSGWNRNLRLANGEAELMITLDVGPRVLSYRAGGSPNIFKVYEGQCGGTGEATWQIRGGHRLWLAPEGGWSIVQDNGPVRYEMTAHGVRLENDPAAPWGIRKQLEITLAEEGSGVTVCHRLTNEGSAPVTVASWGLSVMAPGGVEIIPQPPLGEHGPEMLLPRRVIVPWPYTDLSDPRYRFGPRFVTLSQKANAKPTKLGLYHAEKWVAYHRGETLFLKTVEAVEGATYPDRGCNFETFTNHNMLEIETLGPLTTLGPGESTAHTEHWALHAKVPPPAGWEDEAVDGWIAPFLKSLPLAGPENSGLPKSP